MHTNKKFKDIPEIVIDQKLGIFSAVRGCNSDEAANMNQANIIRYVVQCLISDIPDQKLVNKSYMSFYNDNRIWKSSIYLENIKVKNI